MRRLWGESGSGKTTLLNIMAAFRRENLGFVFRDFNLLDTFSLRDNIYLPLVLSRKHPDEMEKRIRPLARLLGIKPLFKSTLFYGLRPFMVGLDELLEKEADKEENLCGRRILLAEDNELNWEVAEELLSELGLSLEWAENGQICVDKLQASAPGH